MAECCVVYNPRNHLDYLAQAAVEVGNVDFFHRLALTPQGYASIADIEILFKFNILEYCIMKDKTHLFFYLLSFEDGWGEHINPLLEKNPKRLLILSITSGNIPITRFIFEYMLSLMLSPNGMLYNSFSTDENIYHLVAKHCNCNQYDIFSLFRRYPVIQKRKNWADIDGNTPLHYAACAGNMPAFRYLVEVLHFSPLKVNNNNQTALDCIIDKKKNGEMTLKEYARYWLNRYKGMRLLTTNNKKISRSFYLPRDVWCLIYKKIPIIPPVRSEVDADIKTPSPTLER